MNRTSRENSVTSALEPCRQSRRSSKHRNLSSGSLKSAQAGGGRSSASGMMSLESDSEREDVVDSEDEEANTEVAVSERALKIKIATDSSFDVSTSRKGSRENKSESSSHSHSVNTNLTKDETRASFLRSTSSLLLPLAESHGQPLSTPSPSLPSTSAQEPESPTATPKPKSFFTRLKLFTERLGGMSGSGSIDSGNESPPSSTLKIGSQGFHYFRRPKKCIDAASKESPRSEMDYPSTSTEQKSSQSPGVSHCSQAQGQTPSGSGSGAVSSSLELNNIGAASPALSGISSIVTGTNHKSTWKQCSGSLDSVLSKEDEPTKSSPSRKQTMLPRFSSFVQKKTNRMGLLIRRSPRHTTPPEQKKEERKC